MTRQALRRTAALACLALALALGASAPSSASAAACKIILCGQRAAAAPDSVSQLNATLGAVQTLVLAGEVQPGTLMDELAKATGDYLSARSYLIRIGAGPADFEALVARTQGAFDNLLAPLLPSQ